MRTGLFFLSFPEWMLPAQREEHIWGWLDISGARTAHLPLSYIDHNLVSEGHNRGFSIHGADLNSENDIKEAISLDIDQFSTDRLDLALTIIKSKNPNI
jgi:glycerophosphoryl diester phosphodiesterase